MHLSEHLLGTHPVLRLHDSATGASVEVLPTRGATIHQITLPGRTGDPRGILYPMRTEVEIARQRWAKGAHLAPWPNRIQDAVYTFHGTEYHPYKSFRSQGGHAMHGTVMHETFHLDRQAAQEGILALELQGNGWQGYPWPLHMRVELRLEQGGLRMDVKMTNRGLSDAPVGHGWHPYFTLGKDVRSCELQLPAGQRLGMTSRAVPDGTKSTWERFGRPEQIGPDFLNDCIEIAAPSGRATTTLVDPETREGLEVWQETGTGAYAYVQVFTHPRRHCLAIEPMTCAGNAFQNGMGLVVLPAGETLHTVCGVRRI